MIYCLVCKKLTDKITICLMCGNKKSRFILQRSGLFDSLGLNTPQNRIKNAL